MSDLRTRIAYRLRDNHVQLSRDTAARLADAVIAELGLSEHHLTTPSGGKLQRWVTRWEWEI